MHNYTNDVHHSIGDLSYYSCTVNLVHSVHVENPVHLGNNKSFGQHKTHFTVPSTGISTWTNTISYLNIHTLRATLIILTW
jgi:hypothetical protein